MSVPVEDLMVLFENGWISRYETSAGQHQYRITEAGRREANS
jgi:DNA-binding PadR family transcriptional regulator